MALNVFRPQLKRAATFVTLLLLTQSSAFAQGASSTPQQNGPRRFVKEHSFDNPSFRRKQSERAGTAAVQTPLSNESARPQVETCPGVLPVVGSRGFETGKQ